MDLKEYPPLPEDYVSQYVMKHVGFVKHNRYRETYNGCCPFCHEGNSWGKKKRFFYLPNDDYCFCHNCGWSGNGFWFVKQISGLSDIEIREELKDYDIIPRNLNYQCDEIVGKIKTEDLPQNSINLFDEQQIQYYQWNGEIRNCLNYIKQRKIDVMVNRPKSIYYSFDDFRHKKRLIIPYYDEKNNIAWYQSRDITNESEFRYLSKLDGNRTLYGLNNIDYSIPYLFIFEGAINAMSVQNGTCVSGINEKSDNLFTETQRKQLIKYNLYEIIWVLDSPYLDEAARNKIEILEKFNQNYFVWPEKIGTKFKDFNDLILQLKGNEIPYNFIIKNSSKNKNTFRAKIETILKS